MSKNNYKCLINTSAPSCVIIITISAGINHICNISSNSKHCTPALNPRMRRTEFSSEIQKQECGKGK